MELQERGAYGMEHYFVIKFWCKPWLEIHHAVGITRNLDEGLIYTRILIHHINYHMLVLKIWHVGKLKGYF